MSFDTYNKRLLAIGLNIKARNFLVFQGDVESIAERTPRELTSLFEQVSNSEDFREEYVQKQRLKDVSEETSLLAWQKRKAVNAEQRVARAMKVEAEKFKASQKKLQVVKRDYFLWQLFHVESDRQKREKDVAEMREIVDELEKQLLGVNNEVKSARKKRADAQSTEQDAQKKLEKLRRKLRKDDEPVIIKHEQKIAHTEDQLKKNKTALKKMDRDAKAVVDSLQELETELESTKQETILFEKKREEILKSQPLLSLQGKDLEELERKQAEVRAATVELDQSLSKLKQEQQVDQDRLSTLAGTDREQTAQLHMLNERMKDLTERSERMNNKREVNVKKCEDSMTKISQFRKSMSEKSKIYNDLTQKLETSRTKLGREKDNRRENAHSQRQEEYLERLQGVFKGT